MKNFRYWVSALVLLSFVGCQNEDDVFGNEASKQTLVITASLDDGAETRTVHAEDGQTILWQENDALSVFLAIQEGKNKKFNLIEGDGETTASFQGDEGQIIVGGSGSTAYTWANVAYYPYSKDVAVVKDGDAYSLDVTLPTTQHYVSGSFGKEAFPMVAVTESKGDLSFPFKNINALLELRLKGTATVTKVVLTSKSNPLAGNATVKAAYGIEPVIAMDEENTSSSILLDCDETKVVLSENAATGFTFVVPPGSYPANDLTFTVYDSEGKCLSFTIDKDGTLERNNHKYVTFEYVNPQEVVKVKLNGEGSYATIADAVNAITDKTAENVIALAAGTYVLPTSLNGLNLVVEGENADLLGEVVLDMSANGTPQYGAESVTFRNMTVKRQSGAYGGLSHSSEEHFENCIVEGTLVTYAPVVTARKTTFKQTSNELYNVHIYSPGEMEFDGCTFVCEGKSIYMHKDTDASEYDVTIKNSTFTANQVVKGKTAIQMHTEYGICGTLTVEATSATGFDSSINGGLWYELNNITMVVTYNFTKRINGANPDGFEEVAEKEYNIFNANGLVYAAANLFVNGGTFNITEDVDMSGVEYPSVNYGIDENLVIDGNGRTITGLKMPLINSTWSAEKTVKIQNLTLENPAVAMDVEDVEQTVAVGAFIASPGASTEIELNNCHVLGGFVKGGHWAGGLVGWAGGYNGADGPVFEKLVIVNCSVKDCTIESKGSVGGIIGHAANCAWTLVDMDDITVSGNTIKSTGESTVKAGSVMGTVGAAQTYTVNGITHDGYVSVDNATIENNTVTSNGTAIGRIYGRQGSTGGTLYIDGVQVIFEAAQLSTRLTEDKANIAVILADDIDLPITSLGSITGGSGEYKLGGTSTNSIVIDLNNQKLNITTSYWSAIGAKNDNATITIKNGAMTSTGNSAGTWNAYDVRLSNCNYSIENVTFEKPVALDNAGKSARLKTVTITDDGDRYALWITAEGQDVDIDGLTVNSSGRGIKIDEQYVTSPAKVTLDVSNANFTTANKAAIVVKSAAGADITLNNVNISAVVADQVNAVWIDKDAVQHYGLVTVTGGKMVLENTSLLADGVLRNEDEKAYYIVDAAGLGWLTDEVNMNNNSFKGMTVNLLADIDLADAGQVRIGQNGAACFEGTFDGMSHTVSNFAVTVSDGENNGDFATALFGRTSTATVIKNLTLDHVTVEGSHWTAALVGYHHGTIENCHVTNSTISCVHVNENACGDKAGAMVGICADGCGKLVNCSATGCVVKGVRDVGQLVGAGHSGCVDGDCKATDVKVGVHDSFVGCEDEDKGMNISSNSLVGRIL